MLLIQCPGPRDWARNHSFEMEAYAVVQ